MKLATFVWCLKRIEYTERVPRGSWRRSLTRPRMVVADASTETLESSTARRKKRWQSPNPRSTGQGFCVNQGWRASVKKCALFAHGSDQSRCTMYDTSRDTLSMTKTTTRKLNHSERNCAMQAAMECIIQASGLAELALALCAPRHYRTPRIGATFDTITTKEQFGA